MTSTAFQDGVIAIRIVLALVFIQAAVGKMRHWQTFQGVVANYRLLPQGLVAPMSYSLPPIELLLGVGLLVQRTSRWAEAGCCVLLAVFALAMTVNLLRGRRQIDCGCFQSVLKQSLRWRLVMRNAALMAALLAAAVLDTGVVDGWILLNGLLGGVALFTAVTSLNFLWAIVPAFGRSARTHVQFKG